MTGGWFDCPLPGIADDEPDAVPAALPPVIDAPVHRLSDRVLPGCVHDDDSVPAAVRHRAELPSDALARLLAGNPERCHG